MARLIAASMPSEQLANHTTDAAPPPLVGTSSSIAEGCPIRRCTRTPEDTST
jgi:hypothetical protein